uniref:Uncharacterized protein n=1 Tax=Anolis carolinensis TaxID=28377 RepID=A0A803TAD2_ANOCA
SVEEGNVNACPSLFLQQMAAKIGEIPHLNNSAPLVDPSVYSYGVKRPLDDGSKCSHFPLSYCFGNRVIQSICIRQHGNNE